MTAVKVEKKKPHRKGNGHKSYEAIKANVNVVGEKFICGTVKVLQVKCICNQLYWMEANHPHLLCPDCGGVSSRGEPGVSVKHKKIGGD